MHKERRRKDHGRLSVRCLYFAKFSDDEDYLRVLRFGGFPYSGFVSEVRPLRYDKFNFSIT